MNVAICLSTYKRPAGLRRLLEAIARLDHGNNIAVFVADNDAVGREGLAVVEAMRDTLGFPVYCEVEPLPGISHARNKSLSMLQHSDFDAAYVAFTDDDIEPSRQWISELVRVAELYEADLVAGKCEPLFETRPSEMILTSPFFRDDFDCPPTGTPIDTAGTSNMLVRRAVFTENGYTPFDVALTLTGGEDLDFVTRLHRQGRRMVQAAAAVTFETLPASRLTETWMLQRYYRGGTSYAYILKKNSGAKAYTVAIIKKILRLPQRAVLRLLRPTLTNRCRLATDMGFFSFVLSGKTFEEYGRKS